MARLKGLAFAKEQISISIIKSEYFNTTFLDMNGILFERLSYDYTVILTSNKTLLLDHRLRERDQKDQPDIDFKSIFNFQLSDQKRCAA
ncbi:MAG: hypothetical protein AB1403_03590 [Candidatus Riflebacteria bacterium]